MPKSILLPTAVAAALLLLGSACGSDSDDADQPAAKGPSRSAAADKADRDDSGKAGDKDAGDAADKSKQTAKRDAAAKDKASRDKEAAESKPDTESESATGTDAAPEDAEGSSDAGEGGADEQSGGPTGTLTVAGGPFSSLSFPKVQCSGDSSDLYLQSRSEDPAVVLTVLFSGGSAAHASLQTAPESGEGTIWSDDDAEAMSASVQRADDTVTLTNAVLKPFGDDSQLTVTGSLTCNEEL